MLTRFSFLARPSCLAGLGVRCWWQRSLRLRFVCSLALQEQSKKEKLVLGKLGLLLEHKTGLLEHKMGLLEHKTVLLERKTELPERKTGLQVHGRLGLLADDKLGLLERKTGLQVRGMLELLADGKLEQLERGKMGLQVRILRNSSNKTLLGMALAILEEHS